MCASRVSTPAWGENAFTAKMDSSTDTEPHTVTHSEASALDVNPGSTNGSHETVSESLTFTQTRDEKVADLSIVGVTASDESNIRGDVSHDTVKAEVSGEVQGVDGEY